MENKDPFISREFLQYFCAIAAILALICFFIVAIFAGMKWVMG